MASIVDSGVQKWITVFGDVQIIENMRRLENAMERKIVRAAIAKGLKPIVATAVSLAPKKYGFLKKSIKSKVTKMVSGKVYVDPNYIIANHNSQSLRVKMYGAGKSKWRAKSAYLAYSKFAGIKNIRPSKYAHLVEFGTKKVKAHPFMTKAREVAGGKAIEIIKTEISRQIADIKFPQGAR